MSSLRELKKVLDARAADVKKREQERKEQLAAQAIWEEQEERRYQAERKKDLPQREEAWAKIKTWVSKFKKTEEYQQLADQIRRRGRGEYIRLFHGGYGHTRDYGESNACWSEVMLDEEGKLIYRSGYKWMGSHTLHEDAFVDFSLDYLKQVVAHLKSRKVYETIIKSVKSDF